MFIILLPVLEWKLHEDSVCASRWIFNKYLLWINIFFLYMFQLIRKAIFVPLGTPVFTFCFVGLLYICYSWTCLHYQFENPLHLSPMVDLLVPRPLSSLLLFSLFHEHFLFLSLFFLFGGSFLRKNAKLLRFYVRNCLSSGCKLNW